MRLKGEKERTVRRERRKKYTEREWQREKNYSAWKIIVLLGVI